MALTHERYHVHTYTKFKPYSWYNLWFVLILLTATSIIFMGQKNLVYLKYTDLEEL